VRQADDIDVFLLGAGRAADRAPTSERYLQRTRAYLGLSEARGEDMKARWPGFAAAVAVPGLCTGAGFLGSGFFDLLNLVMVYLLGVMLVASRYGRGPSILTSALSVAAFDYFFVPPQFTFAVVGHRYMATFAVMFLVGYRHQQSHRQPAHPGQGRGLPGKARREPVRALPPARPLPQRRRRRADGGQADRHRVRQPERDPLSGRQRAASPTHAGESQLYSLHHADLAVAQWVYDNGHMAGPRHQYAAGAEAIYMPIVGAAATMGVLAMLPVSLRRVYLPGAAAPARDFLNQTALAIERVRLAGGGAGPPR
jgi:two-component system sensor histidine kinase KdpD